MTFLIHSLTLLLWTISGGCLFFGIAGVFVARALQRSLILGWFAGMFLGPIGLGILGISTTYSNRRLRQLTEAI